MHGSTFFKYEKVIRILVVIDSLLPKSVNKRILIWCRGIKGKLGVVIRYIILKNVAQGCGKNVIVKEDVFLFSVDKISFGDNVSIHPMCYIDASSGLIIGNNVAIAHAATIMTTTHTYDDGNIPIKYNQIKGSPVIIEDDVWIACGVRILSGVHIKSRVFLGVGAVVIKKFTGIQIFVGVLAKNIKSLI